MSSSSLNQVSLIGHVGRKPELRHTNGGTPVAQFSIATNDRWRDREGAVQERTEWHRVVAWGSTAEAIANHVEVGRQLLVQGQLRTREWTDKEDVKRFTTEVHTTRVIFLGGRREADEEIIFPADDVAPLDVPGTNDAPAQSNQPA